jgi:coproporphyrinogen III oxidase-like Fe-S oxidoreductase
MTSLRRAEGLDLEFMTKRFGVAKVDSLLRRAKMWIAEGDLVLSNRRLFIPTERFMISDAVIESFFE